MLWSVFVAQSVCWVLMTESALWTRTNSGFHREPSEATRVVDLPIDRRFVPSGIPRVNLNVGDHLAIFVHDRTDGYLRPLLDYVAAGAVRPDVRETMSLELTLGRSAKDMTRRLEDVVGNVPADLEIREWEQNSGDFVPEHFDLPGMFRAMGHERDRLSRVGSQSMLRCASEDCTKFISWLDNPRDYIKYEYRLSKDLTGFTEGHGFVQLCVFKTWLLRELCASHNLDFGEALADLVLAHDPLVSFENDLVQTGSIGLGRVLSELPRTFVVRHPILWLRLLRRRLLVS